MEAEFRCSPIKQVWGGHGGAAPVLGMALLPGGPDAQRVKIEETLWGFRDLMGGEVGEVGRPCFSLATDGLWIPCHPHCQQIFTQLFRCPH